MKRKIFLTVFLALLLLIVAYVLFLFLPRYKVAEKATLSIQELTPLQYPDDPSILSPLYQRYGDRSLLLTRKDETHFDFLFTSSSPHVSTLSFSNVDLSLFIPTCPTWVLGDRNLETITLVEREWNRQQVTFPVMLTGGDGYEEEHLVSAALARNCLNAGLWEIVLTDDQGVYYHGWFSLPLGHYKSLFERAHPFSYWRHFAHLEHWISPAGKKVALDKLRTVLSERALETVNFSSEPVLAEGEQRRKVRTTEAQKVLTWEDFPKYHKSIHFATFVPPGIYAADKKWNNALQCLATPPTILHRRVRSTATLDELELNFGATKLLISGISLATLPSLTPENYPQALIMPMGISVPPFDQTYAQLQASPPQKSPYFSFLLDKENRWLNHHKMAIDGPVLFQDSDNPRLIHLFLLSYERHCLVAHYGFYI